jgi:hypothetical protein
MLQSVVQKVGPVDFPAFAAERIYMREFRLETGLPEDLKHWQQTVDQMLVGVDTDSPIYLMVDQKFISASETHRRPGLHIDGYWNPAGMWDDQKPWNAVSEKMQAFNWPSQGPDGIYRWPDGTPMVPQPKPEGLSAHGGLGRGSHGPRGGVVRDGHGYISEEEYQRRQLEEYERRQRQIDEGKPHKNKRENYDTRNPSKNASGRWQNPTPNWVFDPRDRPEAIILASDISASRALLGEWDGLILPGGDVAHLDFSHMQSVTLEANTAYAGNVTFVHESLPVPHDCYRTVVRLNVPNHTVQ